ncbi:MAG: hypothetical protein IID44_19155 [Planctomycetes bacterium]|nr:hypothetical protein [Planctomycetota bacterium]
MAVDTQVVELAERMQPHWTNHADTHFGKQLWRNKDAKRLVGAYVAHNLILPGTEVFIADGTSGFWVMIGILELDIDVHVLTNNAAISAERLSWHGRKARVSVPQGEVNCDKAAIFGPHAIDFSTYASRNAQLSVMPVTFLTFRKGPHAGDPDARRIKNAVIQNALHLAIIADSSKLGSPPTDYRQRTGPVFVGAEQEFWFNTRRNPNVTIVCDWPVNRTEDFIAEINDFQQDELCAFHALKLPFQND